MNNRKHIFIELLELRKPISYFQMNLDNLSFWDEEPVVVLKISHIRNILSKFIAHEINKNELVMWFELVEARDEIQYGSNESEHDKIADIVSFFANLGINLNNNEVLEHKVKSILSNIKLEQLIARNEKCIDKRRVRYT